MGESDAAAIDALAAYQFSAVWNAQDLNREYAEHAAWTDCGTIAGRLGSIASRRF
ncbi:MAG: hypothetical protein QOH31_669 [Verrucomicrobiota bacterium]|jgi:hypothetical protein